MKDRTPSPLPVPAFTPVARKYRHDGWTDERQRAFIDALAETGSVRHAALRINMSPEGAYALRRQPGAESFGAAWAAALDHGVQSLTDLAIDRAREGVVVPVYSYGKLVGERRVYNDRLLMFCVKHGLGRLGVDPRPLKTGTKAPETRTREEAERHLAVLDEHREELAAMIAGEANALAELAEALTAGLLREAQAREAGHFEIEDEYHRHVKDLLCTLRAGPGRWKVDRDMARIMADVAREYSPQEEPDLGRKTHIGGGATYHERTQARTEAQARIAHARAMWTAATTEVTWAAWRESKPDADSLAPVAVIPAKAEIPLPLATPRDPA